MQEALRGGGVVVVAEMTQTTLDFDELDRQAQGMMEALGLEPDPNGPVLEEVTQEPSHAGRGISFSGPSLAFHRAESAWYCALDGSILPVKDEEHVDQFTRFVTQAATTASKPAEALVDLIGLDYTNIVDRWYALDTLAHYKSRCTLYSSRASAIEHLT